MNLEYNRPEGKLAELTARLSDQLGAEAVMLVVFGSNAGSGCCCNIEPMHPDRQHWLGTEIVRNLRGIASALEQDLENKTFPPHDDSDQHEQKIE